MDSSLTIRGCERCNNVGGSGCGVFTGTLCTLTGYNSTTAEDRAHVGAGCYLTADSPFTPERGIIRGNIPSDHGGAISRTSGDLVVNNSVLDRNQAGTTCAAIWFDISCLDYFQLANCTVAAHTVGSSALSIGLSQHDDTVDLLNSIFVSNIPTAIQGEFTTMSHCTVLWQPVRLRRQLDAILSARTRSMPHGRRRRARRAPPPRRELPTVARRHRDRPWRQRRSQHGRRPCVCRHLSGLAFDVGAFELQVNFPADLTPNSLSLNSAATATLTCALKTAFISRPTARRSPLVTARTCQATFAPISTACHGALAPSIWASTRALTPALGDNDEDRLYLSVTDDGGDLAVTEFTVTVAPRHDPAEVTALPSFASWTGSCRSRRIRGRRQALSGVDSGRDPRRHLDPGRGCSLCPGPVTRSWNLHAAPESGLFLSDLATGLDSKWLPKARSLRILWGRESLSFATR